MSQQLKRIERLERNARFLAPRAAEVAQMWERIKRDPAALETVEKLGRRLDAIDVHCPNCATPRLRDDFMARALADREAAVLMSTLARFLGRDCPAPDRIQL